MISRATIDIYWPSFYDDGKHLLYLIDQPFVSDPTKAKCTVKQAHNINSAGLAVSFLKKWNYIQIFRSPTNISKLNPRPLTTKVDMKKLLRHPLAAHVTQTARTKMILKTIDSRTTQRMKLNTCAVENVPLGSKSIVVNCPSPFDESCASRRLE